MLHFEQKKVRSLLLKGNFGLEKESLRVDKDGYFAHTPHPLPDDPYIVRDFCENQTEINTPVLRSPKEAVETLGELNRRLLKTLNELPEPEYLWPFSNPPYIRNEEDVPVAAFSGPLAVKTEYRNYLSDRYGRYKMAFSGIHVNFSFADELLEADFAASGGSDFQEYKNQLYVALAEGAAAYAWIITAVTAASPLLDGSFLEKKGIGQDAFNGMATSRCSELGYWNYFTPVFDYSDIRRYADSIQNYVDTGLLRYPSELYYPIRLKPKGENDLNTLRESGVNHIELRMVDLNPLCENCLEEKDVFFAQLLLVWLASTPRRHFAVKDQVQAVQNFKNASRYDLKTAKIVIPSGGSCTVADAALRVIAELEAFYRDFPAEVQEMIQFEKEKFLYPEKRYAWVIRKAYGNGFVKKGLELAKLRQASLV